MSSIVENYGYLPQFELPIPETIEAQMEALVFGVQLPSGQENNRLLTSYSPLSTIDVHFALLRMEVPIPLAQISQLRRFVNLFTGQTNDLFHNHKEKDKFHYRYPLVQYKTQQGKAALMGLGEQGALALKQLAENPKFRQQCAEWLGEGAIWQEEHRESLVLYPDLKQRYHLKQYIALNDDNLRQWHQNPGLTARAALLESCLTGHILKFASAIRWQLPPRSLQVELSDFNLHKVRSFDNPFLAFDVVFRTNITLPEGIGLGKAVSHGFGILSMEDSYR